MPRSLNAALIATLVLCCHRAHAQNAAAPQYLGILAGAGGPQQPAGASLYGTDLGFTFTHAGQLYILFGDTWRTAHSICDIQTEGYDHNDDAQATLPLHYPGGVPSMSIAMKPGSKAFEEIALEKNGSSLDMSTNRTPLAGFSDGTRAVGLLHAAVFEQCDAAGSCPGSLSCTKQVGLCEPALLNLTQQCDAATQEGCLQGQRCVVPGTGMCVDPKSPQPKLMNQVALDVELSVPSAAAPTHYTSKHTWPTNKFTNLAARTITKLGNDAEGGDYNPGTNVLLVWGRPGFFASEGLKLPVFLLAHELPLAEDSAGALEFRPSYFAGLDGAGNPKWSSQESEAAPLSLDGQVGGSVDETVAATNQMTISWLPAPLKKWVMLYGGGGTVSGEAGPPASLVIRFADQPWGPWSKPQVHLAEGGPDQAGTPMGPGGIIYHPDCKDTASAKCQTSDPTRPLHVYTPFCLPPMKETDSGYFYAPNIIDEYTAVSGQNSVDIYWNVSVWNPYRVHLYKSTITP